MPNYKSVPGTPKFLNHKMSPDQKTNMKANSYHFVTDWWKKGGNLDTPTRLLPEFIKELGANDDEISKIKSHQIKTNLPFIDEIRVELKNKISQVELAIKRGELKEYDQSNEDDGADDDQDENDEEAAGENEGEGNSEVSADSNNGEVSDH